MPAPSLSTIPASHLIKLNSAAVNLKERGTWSKDNDKDNDDDVVEAEDWTTTICLKRKKTTAKTFKFVFWSLLFLQRRQRALHVDKKGQRNWRLDTVGTSLISLGKMRIRIGSTSSKLCIILSTKVVLTKNNLGTAWVNRSALNLFCRRCALELFCRRCSVELFCRRCALELFCRRCALELFGRRCAQELYS